MHNQVRSLNLASTANTVVYEAIRQLDNPDTRITEYSELPTSRESVNSVPISAATGNISYMWPGMFNTMNKAICARP